MGSQPIFAGGNCLFLGGVRSGEGPQLSGQMNVRKQIGILPSIRKQRRQFRRIRFDVPQSSDQLGSPGMPVLEPPRMLGKFFGIMLVAVKYGTLLLKLVQAVTDRVARTS